MSGSASLRTGLPGFLSTVGTSRCTGKLNHAPCALVRLVLRKCHDRAVTAEDFRERGAPVINITDDLIYELQDQVQGVAQMLARLCEKAGIDPAEARRLPGDVPEGAQAA
jgi:hypothetical protein